MRLSYELCERLPILWLLWKLFVVGITAGLRYMANQHNIYRQVFCLFNMQAVKWHNSKYHSAHRHMYQGCSQFFSLGVLIFTTHHNQLCAVRYLLHPSNTNGKNLGVLQHPQAPTCLRPCVQQYILV